MQVRITKELIEAYRKTEYWVLSPQPFHLSVGSYSPDIIKLHDQFDCRESAFITAWNPYSAHTAPEDNVATNKALARQLAPVSKKLLAGEGRGKNGIWEPEASFLAIGLVGTLAKDIGIEFRQNAVVHINENGIPELLLLR